MTKDYGIFALLLILRLDSISFFFAFVVLFPTGLLDSITSTADAKDCPGVCVHTLATIICYEVLDDVQCPSANMKCCVESNNSTSANAAQLTTQRPTKMTTTMKPVTKTTQKVEKPTKLDANKGEGKSDLFSPFILRGKMF